MDEPENGRIRLSDEALDGDLGALLRDADRVGWRLTVKTRPDEFHQYVLSLKTRRSASDDRPRFAEPESPKAPHVEWVDQPATWYWQTEYEIYGAGTTLALALDDLRAAVASFNAAHPHGLPGKAARWGVADDES